MPLSIIVLIALLLGIVLRRYIPGRPGIWALMLLAAAVICGGGGLSLRQAWQSIDWSLMGYLWGVFILGEALLQTNYLQTRLAKGLSSSASLGWRLAGFIVILAGLSAVLLNDTLAVMMVPLLLSMMTVDDERLAGWVYISAMAITLGSVMLPTGNPQNLLIALQGHLRTPFVTFVYMLAVPTLINLLIMWYWVRKCLGSSLQGEGNTVRANLTPQPAVVFPRYLRWALILFVTLLLWHSLAMIYFPAGSLSIVWAAICPAALIVLFSSRRWQYLRDADYRTLLLFVGMFVVMRGVWESGVLQQALVHIGSHITLLGFVLPASVLLSLVISNVPLVMLYLPILLHHSVAQATLMALAAGSTLAGNVLLMGAASNLIIWQQLDRRAPGHRVSGWRFAAIAIPLTMVNLFIYYIYFWLMR